MHWRRWLARFSFSFIMLAAVCVWEARKASEEGRPVTRYYIGAALLAGAGMAGLRERHRPPMV